jgi:predicted metal-binding membrane protein
LIAAAWAVLAALDADGASGSLHRHAGVDAWSALARPGIDWTLMSFAMMMPVTLPAVRHVAYNSIASRRSRAMAIYTTSYLLVWLVVGVAAAGVMLMATTAGVSDRWLAILVLATAAAWQLTRTKRRAVLACRQTVPLPPQGWRADVACIRFAALQGRRCAISCWPLMLLMAIVSHSIALTVGIAVVIAAEERLAIRERLIMPFAGVFAAAAVLTILAG